MFPALLLTVACANPPLFDLSGPECTPARQGVECGCAECFTWEPETPDPAAGTVAAEWYEVLRVNPDGTTQNVGSTVTRNRAPFHYRNGPTIPGVIVRLWCAAWDVQFPTEAGAYLYRVRGCRQGTAAVACASWSAGSIPYAGAPYDCYAGGKEIACYTGDPVHRP